MNKQLRLTVLFLVIVFATTLLILKSLGLYSNLRSKPKNLILISVDTLRANSMGIYGYKQNTTPNIDAWAKNATVFDNAYTQVPITYPSFAALMTGISPFESGIYNNAIVNDDHSTAPLIDKNLGNLPLDNKTQTLAGILKDNNYSTAAYIINGALDREITNLHKGFDIYENPRRLIAEKAVSWLSSRKPDKPFFLWVHFLNPHAPYMPHEEFQCKFNNQYCDDIEKITLSDLNKQRVKFEGCQAKPLDEKTVAIQKTLYDGEIADTDRGIGYILKNIASLGLDKNSIVVFYADHGESFEKNYYFNHSLVLYESSVKIPLIIYAPDNLKKGLRSDIPVKNTDIFTTLLNLLEVKYPIQKQYNNDFSSIFLSNESGLQMENESIFYINFGKSKFAVRKGQYKYILSNKDGSCAQNDHRQLFNIAKDPGENINLISVQTDKASELHKELMQHIQINLGSSRFVNPPNKFDTNINPTKKKELIEELKSLGY